MKRSAATTEHKLMCVLLGKSLNWFVSSSLYGELSKQETMGLENK